VSGTVLGTLVCRVVHARKGGRGGQEYYAELQPRHWKLHQADYDAHGDVPSAQIASCFLDNVDSGDIFRGNH
jgi:hypothetical protein